MAGIDDISVANFTTISVVDLSESPSFAENTKIESVSSIGEVSDEKTIIDVSEYGVQYLRKLVGSANVGAIEVVCNFIPSATKAPNQAKMLGLYKSGKLASFQIMMTDATGTNGDSVAFRAYVASKSISNDFDATRTITFSLAVDGAIGDVAEKTSARSPETKPKKAKANLI